MCPGPRCTVAHSRTWSSNVKRMICWSRLSSLRMSSVRLVRSASLCTVTSSRRRGPRTECLFETHVATVGAMRVEEPSWEGPYYGTFGVLVDDGDRVQCHVCGDWYANLGSHTFHAHGLTADAYRREFGLMQATKLIGPTYRAQRRQAASEHLRTVETPGRDRIRSLSTEERRQAMANAALRREHRLKRTEPERIQAAHEAVWGDLLGYPDAYLNKVAELFVDELRRGQRGVYRRLGDRMGVGWSTARSRVMAAVRRKVLVWTGGDYEPAAHLPGAQPWDPPGSFDFMFRVLKRWAGVRGHARVPRLTVFEGEYLGAWVNAVRKRHRQGALSTERTQRLERLPGWAWARSSGRQVE